MKIVVYAPASNVSKEITDDPIFMSREFPVFNVRSKIVKPSKPAALPASL